MAPPTLWQACVFTCHREWRIVLEAEVFVGVAEPRFFDAAVVLAGFLGLLGDVCFGVAERVDLY